MHPRRDRRPRTPRGPLPLALLALALLAGPARGLLPESAWSDLHWRLLGPFRGGWATAVAGEPGAPGTFFFGAADGGVWKTTDAGVTWRSEAIFQEQAGNPIAHVDIPPALNTTGVYAGAVVKGAAHADAAKKWLAFLTSPAALKIFQSYGFQPYPR